MVTRQQYDEAIKVIIQYETRHNYCENFLKYVEKYFIIKPQVKIYKRTKDGKMFSSRELHYRFRKSRSECAVEVISLKTYL